MTPSKSAKIPLIIIKGGTGGSSKHNNKAHINILFYTHVTKQCVIESSNLYKIKYDCPR
jgi:hypothetical protein